uniref:Uncharacterized protein n=1 Tax=Rhizophagus irregularis (strain DAOM 181602 / DAOM 197198 / MUCL 43194) TaxID=747089 RepID=U9V4C1_RHIID
MYSPLLSYHSVALPKTLNGITKKRNLTDFTNYVEKRVIGWVKISVVVSNKL